MKKINRLIIVDDDPCSNMICKFIISQVAGDLEVLEFILPEEGITYIEENYNHGSNDLPTVLLLDINMPEMTGWDFLERYDKTENIIKEQFTIYMLSSSVDRRDKERAEANKYVKDFLTKPLSTEMVEKIFGKSILPDFSKK